MSKRILIEVFHILIALGIVLAYLYAISLFKPEYVILSHGIIWSRVYSIDLTYGALILSAVVLVISACVYAIGGFKAVKPAKVSVYILAILTVICGLPLIYWIAYMWNPQVSQNHNLIGLSELDAGLFHIYAPIYPLLLLALLYAWLPPIIAKTFKRHVRLKVTCNKTLNTVDCHKPSDGLLMERLGLAFAILLSVVLPIIPYLPSLNPTFKPVSVDIRHYSNRLNNMLTVNLSSAIEYAFYGIGDGYRPLYLLMLYCLVNLGIPRDVVLNFEALLIAPSFALAVYFTAKRLSGNGQYASLSSLVAMVSFNMTVGMMAGFFSQWAMLILFYICVALTPGLAEHNLKVLIIILVASIIALYVHPWTWSLLMAILTIQLIISAIEPLKRGEIKLDKHLLIILIGNSIGDLLKIALTPNYSGLKSLAEVVIELSFKQFLHQFENLQRITISYVAGLFYNPLYIVLAFIGVLSLLNRRNEFSRLIIIWVALISLVFPFNRINPQSHLLFATPFPILITEGLWVLSKLLARFDSRLPKLFIIFFIISSLTYTVRALCNLI